MPPFGSTIAIIAAEAGVADLVDVGTLPEPSYELRGVGLAALHPQRQRAQSAQGEPGLEGAGDGADEVAAALEHAVQLARRGSRSRP